MTGRDLSIEPTHGDGRSADYEDDGLSMQAQSRESLLG